MTKVKIAILIIVGLFNFSTAFAIEAELQELRQELAKDKEERIKEFKEYKRELAQAKKEIEREFKEEIENSN